VNKALSLPPHARGKGRIVFTISITEFSKEEMPADVKDYIP
jgi:hypothetical protein